MSRFAAPAPLPSVTELRGKYEAFLSANLSPGRAVARTITNALSTARAHLAHPLRGVQSPEISWAHTIGLNIDLAQSNWTKPAWDDINSKWVSVSEFSDRIIYLELHRRCYWDVLVQATRLVMSATHPMPHYLEVPPAVGPIIDAAEVHIAADSLKQDGVHLLRLVSERPDEYLRWVDEIVGYAMTHRCTPVRLGTPERVWVDLSGKTHESLCRFQDVELVRLHGLQSIVTDTHLHAVAAQYLDCMPRLTRARMWWSVPADKALSNMSQVYHRDADYPQWVKFFVYLTDVPDAKSGAFKYVRGSHRIDNFCGHEVSECGRTELADDDVMAKFSDGSQLEILGPAGTIFAADTWGVHRGQLVHTGHSRLVLEFVYANVQAGNLVNDIAFLRDVSHHW